MPVATAFEIASYIINKCIDESKPISNLQLQKILYFCQKEYGDRMNKPLFNDDFEAWRYGPVIPEVYRAYSLWGGNRIDWRTSEDVRLPQKAKDIIDPIIDEKRELQAWELVDQTHVVGSPWYRIYAEGRGEGAPISKKLICPDIEL